MRNSEGRDRLTRRHFLGLAALAGGLVCRTERLFGRSVLAQSGSGFPLPDEPVEATLKRLFSKRAITPAAGKIQIELPQIAEDAGNVPITVEANFPVSRQNGVSHLYIIADKNRRPMLAKFSFTPDSGRAFHFHEHPFGNDDRRARGGRDWRWRALRRRAARVRDDQLLRFAAAGAVTGSRSLKRLKRWWKSAESAFAFPRRSIPAM